MIWRLLLVLLFWSPTGASRGLAPMPEPGHVDAAVLHYAYLPIAQMANDGAIEGADTRPIYGYASPHRRTYNVPHYNWHALPAYCANRNFWPLVRGQIVASDMVARCDDGQRMLLIYNEPELAHYHATPRQAVEYIANWRAQWTGPIACCGNFYARTGGDLSGLEWMLTLIEEYHIAHGIVPPIDAIHLHVYEQGPLDVGLLAEWRNLANAYGWQMIVTESGTFPSDKYTPDEIAARLPAFVAQVEEILRPDVLMWFSDYLQPDALGTETDWHNLNLTNIDGSTTVVGQAWETYTQTTIDGALAGK